MAIGSAATDVRHICASIQADALALAICAAGRGDLDRHLVERLVVGAHNGMGCAVLGEQSLAPPLASAARSILENLFASYWATQTPENGKALLEAANDELVRSMRVMLKRGRARAVHKTSGEDHTATILADPRLSSVRKAPGFETMANGCGLGQVYDQVYRFMSNLAHTTNPGLFMNGSQDQFISATLASVSAILSCLQLVVGNYVMNGQHTRVSTLEEILNVRLKP